MRARLAKRLAAAAGLWALGCGGAKAPLPSAQVPPGPHPNILFIVVDDLSTTLPIYDHPEVKAPGIEELARRGTVFERAYCQYPICNPSRTSFLSGRRPESTGVFVNRTRPDVRLAPALFLPNELHRLGYYTLRAGKIFHGSGAESLGQWDRNAPITFAVPPPGEKIDPASRQSRGDHEEGDEEGLGLLTKIRIVPDAEAEPLRDRRISQHTVRELKKVARQGGRFFFALGFARPHLPFEAPARFFALYPPESIQLAEQPPAGAPPVPAAALKGRAFVPAMSEAAQRKAKAAYYASLSFMDGELLPLWQALDQLDLWKSTIVVLTSDHGFQLGEHGLWGKLSLYEETLRVPLIIVAPGLPGGQRSVQPVELVDLYPTLFELAGLPPPPGLEGRSLAPLLRNPQAPWDFPAVSVMRGSSARKDLALSIATERYRYTEWGGPEEAELYDLRADPRELKNLAADPALGAEKQRLSRQVAAARERFERAQ